MNKIREMKAITLVALVITIIVLLILAGVSISVIIGQDELIGKATSAANKYNEASINEAEGINVLMNQIKNVIPSNKIKDIKLETTYVGTRGFTVKGVVEANSIDMKKYKWIINGVEQEEIQL